MPRTVPLGRLGTEEEMAWLIAYLASPAGDFFSGDDDHDRRRPRQLVRLLAARRLRRGRRAADRGEATAVVGSLHGLNARPNKRLVLAAMVFAVAMTFIDQTIVSIAVPDLQKDLDLSATGVQWVDQRLPARARRRCSPSAAGSPTSPATDAWC